MRITTGDQLQQYRAEGWHFTLNRQGQLETQNSFMHVLEKIGDAFRSITSSGRAAIAARQAALQAAMDDVLLQGAVINAARTPLPRPSAASSRPLVGATGNASARSSASEPVRTGNSPAAGAGQHMALMAEVHEMAESEIARLYPDLGEEVRTLCSLAVSERMQSFLHDADVSGGVNRSVLREIVLGVIDDIIGQTDPKGTGSSSAPGTSAGTVSSTAFAPNRSSAQVSDASAGVGISEKEKREEEEIRTTAETLLRGKFPQKSEEERKTLLLYVCNEMQAFMPGLREEIDRNPNLLKQTVAGFVNGLSGSEKPALPPEPTPRSASLHRTHTLTAQDIRPDTLMIQGQNTCFMISVLNSMMTSEKGRRILADSLGSDGRMTIGGQSFRSPNETNGSFSPLEHSLGAAYQVHGADVDSDWQEGRLGDALVVARMFGMKVQSQDRVMDWSPEIIQSFLDAGQMVLLYSGVHYTAVVGVEGDRLIVRNSLDPGAEEYVDINTVGDSRLQVFEYPDE